MLPYIAYMDPMGYINYPLVNVYITMERSTILDHFNSYVSLPEGMIYNKYIMNAKSVISV